MCGIGFGLFQTPNNREMLSNTTREHSANASGVLAIMRTFGQCLGAALMGLVLSLAGSRGEGIGQAVRLSLWLAVAATVLATLVSASRIRALPRAASGAAA